MTDSLRRIFVEVRYKDRSARQTDLMADLERRLDGYPQEYQITPHKPPRIFSDEEIEDRFVHLFKVAEVFRERFKANFGLELELDPRLLYIATISAYDDIERYKAYHLAKPYSDRSDAVKRAAYLTKWISKLAPFQTSFDTETLRKQISQDEMDVDARPALASILFSIMVAMVHISIVCKKDVWLTADAEFRLAYDLLYRRVNEDALLATYQKIVDIALGVQVVKVRSKKPKK